MNYIEVVEKHSNSILEFIKQKGIKALAETVGHFSHLEREKGPKTIKIRSLKAENPTHIDFGMTFFYVTTHKARDRATGIVIYLHQDGSWWPTTGSTDETRDSFYEIPGFFVNTNLILNLLFLSGVKPNEIDYENSVNLQIKIDKIAI